jgi:hypothetical protein
MTLVKRVVTFIVLFGILFVMAYLAICMVGGAVCGAMAGAEHPNDAARAGAAAGAAFVNNHYQAIIFSTTFFSLVASALLSFSGILPWCKKPPLPPNY